MGVLCKRLSKAVALEQTNHAMTCGRILLQKFHIEVPQYHYDYCDNNKPVVANTESYSLLCTSIAITSYLLLKICVLLPNMLRSSSC